MSWLKLRIGMFADLHYSVDSQPEEHKWFPAVYNLLAKFSQKWADRFLSFWDKLTQKWAGVVLDKLSRQTADFYVSCGDNTPGINEEGMKTEKAVKQGEAVLELIKQNLPEPIYFVAGGHDIGYCDKKVPGGQGKEPSDLSCQNFEKIFGPVWQTKIVNGFRLVFLYFYPLVHPEEDFQNQPHLLKLKQIQKAFLKYELNQTHEPLIIFIHNPFALLKIWPQLLPFRHRLVCILTGHVHSLLIFRFLKWFCRPWREFRVEVVPSPWGWCGLGRKGRGAFLEVYSDGKYQLKII